MNRLQRRVALFASATAIVTMGLTAGCSSRTEQPATDPGTAVPSPTEKQGCAVRLNGNCIEPGAGNGPIGGGGFDSHHNNNRNNDNSSAHGPVGGGGNNNGGNSGGGGSGGRGGSGGSGGGGGGR